MRLFIRLSRISQGAGWRVAANTYVPVQRSKVEALAPKGVIGRAKARRYRPCSAEHEPSLSERGLEHVGPPGIEPGLHAPHACVLPVYDSPNIPNSFYKKNQKKKRRKIYIHFAP